jgi:anhydro-N-acetylmuramic acid kinase
MILNNLSLLLRRPFDKDGILASAGQVHHVLLKKLNCLSYYRRPCPKSLGREWFETVFYPLIQKERINVYDKLATCTEHAAIQIAEAIEKFRRQPCTVLVTGGGAHNKFLIERIRHHAAAEMVLPDESLIDMKEAIVFALLAVLRINNLVNCFKSATGARSNSISGALYKTP